MAILADASSVTINGLKLALSEFPMLVRPTAKFLEQTLNLEAQGKEVAKAKFEEAQLTAFIRKVCIWGNYSGIAGRILKQNPMSKIQAQFIEADRILRETPQDRALALRALNALRQLGTPSFASKHLRSLHPKVCPVLDRYIRAGLHYPFNPSGYQEFSEDCLGMRPQDSPQHNHCL